MGPIAVELSEDSRTLIVLFTLAIRVLLAALGVNISRVDVRPSRDGSDGYHDIVGDFAGVIDVVGEIKCRLQSLRDGVAYKPHGVAICKGVLSDYEAVRQTRFPDRPVAMLMLCTMARTPGRSWVYPTLRLAICSHGVWYSGFQWPYLPPWRSAWSHEQRLLLPGVLPSRTELENKVRSVFLPRLQQQPQQVQRVQAPEPVVAANDVATVFVAIVPRRKNSPAHAPSTWTRLYTLLTPFEGRRGVSVCMAQDLLNQLRKDTNHVKQDVAKWRALVPLCNDASHCFQLEKPYQGVSGQAPWVLTLECTQAVFLQVYSGRQ